MRAHECIAVNVYLS